MKEKARKLMEKRESMISELLETLEILGYEVSGATVRPVNVTINKGKIVKVTEEKIVEKVVNTTDDAYVKKLEKRVKTLSEAFQSSQEEYDNYVEQAVKESKRHLDRIYLLSDENAKLYAEIESLKEQLEKANATTTQPQQEVKKEVKENHKVSSTNKLINCGPNTGENEVLFIEKRRDNIHLWYGQIRMNNYVRNFHWSNELPLPTVYGIENFESLKAANELIRAAVNSIDPKELTKYNQVPDLPEFGAYKARQFYGALEQGAYIYMSPEMQTGTKDDDVVCKGYVCDHAFILRRSGDVQWRHYNYINSKKPFESTPSRHYNEKQMMDDVQKLYNAVCEQYEKAISKDERSNTTKWTPDKNDNKELSNKEILINADISDLF